MRDRVRGMCGRGHVHGRGHVCRDMHGRGQRGHVWQRCVCVVRGHA